MSYNLRFLYPTVLLWGGVAMSFLLFFWKKSRPKQKIINRPWYKKNRFIYFSKQKKYYFVFLRIFELTKKSWPPII